MRSVTAVVLLAMVGCKPSVAEDFGPVGLAVLGGGLNDVSETLETMGNRNDGHDKPTDLAFNPDVEGELWVVNKSDDSATIYDDAGTDAQGVEHIVDPYALHFMEKVTSIAFGAPGTFATCQDGTNSYNGQGEGNGFTGPTLWSSDRSIFGVTNPEAAEALSDLFGQPVDLGSHIDMLHESPDCMGIAWDHDNVYWVFDGDDGTIVRYDFAEDHGPGYDDHSDGIISRYVNADVKRKRGTVSHMILDHETSLLYVADSGNNRITVLDTLSGRQGDSLPAKDCWQGSCADHHEWVNADYSTLIDGEAVGLSEPAGIALVDGMLYVTDSENAEIYAFTLDGTLVDWAATGLASGALGGIYGVSATELWLVNGSTDRVLRLMP